jgi:hypothetical protein
MRKDGKETDMPDRMNITLDENVAKTLRQTTLKRFGKLRGASLIIQEALERYFEEEGISIEENATA